MNDQELDTRLSELEGASIIRKRVVNYHRMPFVYELTPAGGRLWEEERQPDWSRYVVDSYSQSRGKTNREIACVLAYCREALDPFFESAIRHRLWEPNNSPIRVRRRRYISSRLLPWRGAQEIVSACIWIRGEYDGQPSIDWKAMAKEATWWRSIDDWDRLRRKQL